MEVTGDPAAMRSSAARLRLRAETVATAAAQVANRVDGMVYAGPAADRFRLEMSDQHMRVQRAAGRFIELADTLVRTAAQVEAAQLDAQAAGGGVG
jgi:uncharacterized protein YukE